MSTFKVQRVEFEPPIKGELVKPFRGWVCVGFCENNGGWVCGIDTDTALDAYDYMTAEGTSLLPHTVQMFRVDPA